MIEILGWRNFDDVKSVYKMIDNLELLLWQRNGKDSAETSNHKKQQKYKDRKLPVTGSNFLVDWLNEKEMSTSVVHFFN